MAGDGSNEERPRVSWLAGKRGQMRKRLRDDDERRKATCGEYLFS